MPVRHSVAPILSVLLALAAAPCPAAAQDPQPQQVNPAWLTVDQVRTVLRARGYNEVGEVEREGDTYKVTDAVRYGEKVPELRIDALTGAPRDAPLLTESQARSLLQERGYTDVEEAGREGEVIHLRAHQGDTPVEVRVNARTGAVIR
jgi:hypothetical protein